MPRTPLIILASFVVVLAAAVGGVFAYDSSRTDVIGNGVPLSLALGVGGQRRPRG